MVGVAGKSKGCNTCRKRKIHCDGDRPSCARCKKGNRVCGGYQRELHFKNLSALDRDTLLTRTQPWASLTDLRTTNTRSAYDLTPCSTPESDDTATSTSKSQSPKLQCTRYRLSLSDLFLNFLDNYIPREGAELQNGRTAQLSWLQAIDPLQVNDAALDRAILALSLVCLGRKHGDERLRHEGTANYGRALHRLQDILSHHSLLLEEQTLASCMALSIFEMLEVSGENTGGWVSHVEGSARLIRFRGPELHVVGLSHRLFLDFRSSCITHALAARKSTYLAQQDWLTVPWKVQPKSDLDQLLDLMAQIATLVEKAARLNTSPAFDVPPAQRMALVQQGWDFHSQLENWYQGLVRKQAGPLYYEQPSSARFLSHQLASVFPTSLHFLNFEIARLHLSYWTILLLLYTSILAVPLSSLSDLNPTSSLVASVGNDFTHRQALELARLIAQSMEYVLSEDMHILGPQKVFFALRTAMHVFTSTEQWQEMDCCKEIFDKLDRRGYSFGKILCRCEWDDIPALLAGKFSSAEGGSCRNANV